MRRTSWWRTSRRGAQGGQPGRKRIDRGYQIGRSGHLLVSIVELSEVGDVTWRERPPGAILGHLEVRLTVRRRPVEPVGVIRIRIAERDIPYRPHTIDVAVVQIKNWIKRRH